MNRNTSARFLEKIKPRSLYGVDETRIRVLSS